MSMAIMSSDTAFKFPTINFSTQPLTPEWELTRAQVRRASEEFGCFEAIFDKITSDTRTTIFGSVKELFDLPTESKMKNVSEKPYHGYIGHSPVAPLYESIGFEQPSLHENVESLTNAFWPEGNPKVCESIESYSKQISELDQIVRRMILESFGVDKKHLEEHLESSSYLLRVMKYEGPQSNETKLGVIAHTDLNYLTILYQLNQVQGLEVQDKMGDWFSIKPSPDSFIVLIGDSLNAVSNGRLHPAKHRVMMSGNEARYSTGLFCIPKFDYIVKAPQEVIDQQHPQVFKPYKYHDFLQYYATAAGQKADLSLKAFCGISDH